MISKEILKDIIKSNEEFIISIRNEIIPRQDIVFPAGVRKVKVIYGPRRTGKTFLLYDIFQKNIGRVLYLDFEDERLSALKLDAVDRIRECFFELYPEFLDKKGVIFLFDEIQNIKGWEKYARRLTEREGIDLYVAGSSSQINPHRISSTLRGREWSIALFPFSFKEFLRTKMIAPKNAIYGKDKIRINRYLTEFIKYGGFPEVVQAKNEFDKQKILHEYINAMHFKDLVEQFNLKNVNLLNTLRESLFSSFGAKFSVSSFYRQYKDKFPFSKTSLFRYYNAFLTSMLVYETRIFSQSAYKRLRNPPKIYLLDMGLASRLKSFDWGRALENLVFLMLKRAGYKIYYYAGDMECDFIISTGAGDLSAIQVAWEMTDENRQREYGGLIEACKLLRKKEGVLITRDQDFVERISGIIVKGISFARWYVH